MSEQQAGTSVNPELRALIEYAAEASAKIFQRTGSLRPMYHAIKRNGEHMIIPATGSDKTQTVALAKAAFELFDVVRYVFIDEAWVLESKGRAILPSELARIMRTGLQDHPDRREALMFVGEDGRGLIYARRLILRPEHGRAKLAPLEWIDDQGGIWMGRMIGLLPRAGATMQ